LKALVWLGPGQVRLQDRPVPEPGPGEILLRILAVGVCATDRKVFLGKHPRVRPPRVLGHEVVGEVFALGPGVEGLRLGERVSLAPNFGCGRCALCTSGWTNLCPQVKALGLDLDGGFAEYLLVPREAVAQGNLLPLPQSVPTDLAVLAEPLATALCAQEALGVGPGDAVLIVGGGPMGLLNALAARARGASWIALSERRPWRRTLAEKLGVDLAVGPEETLSRVLEATGGRGVQAVTVTVPDPNAVRLGLSLLAPLGRLNLFAGFPRGMEEMTLDGNTLHYGNRSLVGTFAANLRQHRAALNLLQRLELAPLITHRIHLKEAEDGLMPLILSKDEMRVVIIPD
jgi:L-iditol 2-dehydrogenase